MIKNNFRSLVVTWTVCLLVLTGLLSVLAVCDAALGWDIFSPKAEKILYALIATTVITTIIGVTLTSVLGLNDIVIAIEQATNKSETLSQDTQKKTKSARKGAIIIFAAILLLVGILSFINSRVQQARADSFSDQASAQMAHFDAKLKTQLTHIDTTQLNDVPEQLSDMLSTLEGLSFIQKVTLYLPNAQDQAALWYFSPCCWKDKQLMPKRTYAAKSYEKVIQSTLVGKATSVESLNQERAFEHYHVITSNNGQQALAVLRIEANRHESFRDY